MREHDSKGAAHLGGPAISSSPQPKPSSILDRSELLERVGGDRELLVEIVELFSRDCPKQMAELSEAVACGDAAKVKRVAHAVKGQVGNLASATATAAALRLEMMGSEGNLAGAREELASLERAIEQLKMALTAICSEAE